MADISGYLNTIRQAASGESVRDAIIQCLNKINSDNPTTIKPLNVSANGTYTSQTGFAYNPVTVNVPTGGSSSYTFEELEVTENGEYEPDDDKTMFSKVTVDVPQFAKDLMESFTITANGEYDALLDGYDGYAKVIVNVNEATGDGPFTVKFYDVDQITLLATQTVPKNGSANYTGKIPTSSSGLTFVGWNPNPVNVTRDLKCYPAFKDISYDPTEISDDWATILANRGEPYPLGAYKILAYGATYNSNEIRSVFDNTISDDDTLSETTYIMMYKVAVGENGTTSSWLGTHWNFNRITANRVNLGLSNDSHNWWTAMGDKYIRGFLNGPFFNHMADAFKQNIKTVIKYSRNPDGIYEATSDRIWVPGMKELCLYKSMVAGDESNAMYDHVFDGVATDETFDDVRWWSLAKQNGNSLAYFKDYLSSDRALYNKIINQVYDGSASNYKNIRDAYGGRDVYNTRVDGRYFNNVSVSYLNFGNQAGGWERGFNIGFCL